MLSNQIIFTELSFQLQKFLDTNNLTVHSFANKFSIDIKLVRDTLNEKTMPTDIIIKICDALNISMDTLRYPPNSEGLALMQEAIIQWAKCPEINLMKIMKNIMSQFAEYEWRRDFQWLKETISHPDINDNWQCNLMTEILSELEKNSCNETDLLMAGFMLPINAQETNAVLEFLDSIDSEDDKYEHGT